MFPSDRPPVTALPRRRLLPVLMMMAASAFLLAVLLVWQPTWLGGELAHAGTFGGFEGHGPVASALPDEVAAVLDKAGAAEARRASLHRRVALGAAALATAAALLGLVALWVGLTQRLRTDLVLGLSGLSWALYAAVAWRGMPGSQAESVSMLLQQTLLLMAAGSLIWYGLRVLSPADETLTARSWWPVVLSGVLLALVLNWARGGGLGDSPWIVPVACLATGLLALLRLASDAGLRSARRSLGFWWVLLLGALAVSAGAAEIGLRLSQPDRLEARATLWFMTRWTVIALLASLVARRLYQLASSAHQLGRSHRHWRRRLRSLQAEVRELQRGLSLRDGRDHQRARRDLLVRETLGELRETLESGASRSTAPMLVDEVGDLLAWLSDSLDETPSALAGAIERVRTRVERRVAAVGGRLDWNLGAGLQGIALPSADTLMWQQLVDEAVGIVVVLGWARDGLQLQLDRHQGETGCHLHFSVTPRHDPQDGRLFRPVMQDLFGALPVHGPSAGLPRLQRLATALGAQMVLDGRPGQPAGLEVVMPLRG